MRLTGTISVGTIGVPRGRSWSRCRSGTTTWQAGDDELLARVAAAGRAVGQNIGAAPARGAADTNVTGAAGVPSLDRFGPLGAGAYAPDEQIVIASLTERATLLASVLQPFRPKLR